jgi:hypothetical protein
MSTIMADYATIQVRKETKKLLEQARLPGETFDAVVRRTLAEAEDKLRRDFFDEMYAALDKPLRPLR